ncbi:polyprenyl synthetase family protein [Bosea sp. (in: a-proteobacteria)]|uniref:polyprenyl synthetase family protein n=1 Tax=Bosea sp. (in: a-proteobacteria) TaxID=1871050 RepID=UPI0027375173|nr:polyprenyl synthetase family protein [Bosea sp. (in: a-proteobacteria)]MDP3409887.1 polyprenyl synthetase family protein [Bosea sp. (in: a-proteobacteria)]
MDTGTRIEQTLDAAIVASHLQNCPPLLAQAMRHAVFPGGARIRPRLTLAVARACGDPEPIIANAAAAAIEFLHCASLVHDDLPCFDDAAMRRGKASVHKAYGEPLAVLAGDALIVLAFETLAEAAARQPQNLATLVRVVSAAVGSRGGIVAGQAWESEAAIDCALYHQAKTGALFAGATMAGAAAAGVAHQDWRWLGEKLGEAFQVADDIRDVAATPQELGKPCGQDAAHLRPNYASAYGLGPAIAHLDALVLEAIAAIPACPGRQDLGTLIGLTAKSFLPESLQRRAA